MALISLCIPTFNRAQFLAEAIDSVLSQSFGDFELLVVDNASTDDTASVVRRYTDPRVRFVRNERNLGMIGNFNRCLELAQSEIVWIFADDDLLEPDALAHVTGEFARQDVGLLFGRHRYLSDSGASAPSPEFKSPGPWRAGLAALRAVTSHSYSSVTVSFRRSLFVRCGGFSPRFPYSGDEEYWARLATVGSIGLTNQVLITRRLHPGNLMVRTWREPDFYQNFSELYVIVAKYLEDAGATVDEVKEARLRPFRALTGVIVPTLLREGDVSSARHYLALHAKEARRLGAPLSFRRTLALAATSLLPGPVASRVVAGFQSAKALRTRRAKAVV